MYLLNSYADICSSLALYWCRLFTRANIALQLCCRPECEGSDRTLIINHLTLLIMKHLFIVAGMITAFSIVSCKKDKSEDNGNNGIAKLLTKVTSTEGGQTTVYTLTYDGSKHLTAIKSMDNIELTNFTYDGNGNLVKVEDIDDDFRNIYTYTYTNNVPVSGTFKSWKKRAGGGEELIEDDRLTYTITNEQVTKIHLDMNLVQQEADFTLQYANGNLRKVSMDGTDLYTSTFTFGNRRSPYPQISKYVLDQAGFSLQFASKNELLTAKFSFFNTDLDKTITTTYTYDADGYALTSTDGTTQLKFGYQ